MTHSDGRRGFDTTHWSLVLAAGTGSGDGSEARAALEQLCQAYWYPLYSFARHRGYSAEDAQDLTQSFFTRIIETDGLRLVDPDRGRFRSYLLGAMKHFLANEWHRARAQKRGGGITMIDLDGLDPETRFALEPSTEPDPDASFDRQWALELTVRAIDRLRDDARARGKEDIFDALKNSLTTADVNHAETAARLGMSEGAVKVAVHRLRQRYRQALRGEIAATVADESDVGDEMRHLIAALRGS